MIENSGKLLVKLIEKFTDKFEKSQQVNYYTMLTMKYCIKLLDAQIGKILLIKKNHGPKEPGKFVYLF